MKFNSQHITIKFLIIKESVMFKISVFHFICIATAGMLKLMGDCVFHIQEIQSMYSLRCWFIWHLNPVLLISK